MMIVSNLNPNDTPTDEQIKEIEKAKQMPITYDEDCPALTPAMEKAFKVSVRTRNRLKSIS